MSSDSFYFIILRCTVYTLNLSESLVHERDCTYTLDQIYDLLPAEAETTDISQSKRSLLPFGGTVLSLLFGTATQGELNSLRDQMAKVGRGISQVAKGLQVESYRMRSFVGLVNNRLDSDTTGGCE